MPQEVFMRPQTGEPSTDIVPPVPVSETNRASNPISSIFLSAFYDYLSNIEQFVRVLMNMSTMDRMKPAVPNGGGCADCDTMAALNPAQGLVSSLTALVSALNSYLRIVFSRG